jgi:cholesterol oxidase
MRRISSPVTHLKSHYSVVVVGSGYGGAIAASRLARAGQQVCVLERGREMVPGEYPRTADQLLGEMQVRYTGEKTGVGAGSELGLFEFNMGKDATVVAGCGLGGTSLINASVSLRPDPRVFQDPSWPRALREDPELIAQSYERAEQMLRPNPYPEHFPKLKKMEAFAQSASKLEGRFYPVPIGVTFQDRVNAAGVEQQACKLCGDCATGCNYGSKNSLLMNYLPDAHAHGAEIFTEVSVRWLAREGHRWRIYYQLQGVGRDRFNAPELFLTADRVILGAGSMGSTEILLRSRERGGLSLSGVLGGHFSSNGDALGFTYNADIPVHAIGAGPNTPEEVGPVGPCITGIIDQRPPEGDLEKARIIEDAVIPGAFGPLLPGAFLAASALLGKDTDPGLADGLAEAKRSAISAVRGPYHGALQNTQTYVVMGHDDGAGKIELRDDKSYVVWPDAGKQETFQRTDEQLEQATTAIGGTFIRNPMWTRLTDYGLLITHPMGGCAMGEDAKDGVVDHECRVFSSDSGPQVHEGLYVCDAAIIPRSLGVNPLLTISAMTERFCTLIARRHGWTIDYTPAAAALPPTPPRQPGVIFTETMGGHWSPAVGEDYKEAGNPQRPDASPFRFIVTILVEDVRAFIESPEHSARLVGSVLAPGLSPSPLTIAEGDFQLFIKDPARPHYRLMRYAMKLLSAEGERFFFEGIKEVHDDAGFDLWSDTTTLFIQLWRGEDMASPPMGKGILRITAEDFTRQLGTMRALHAKDGKQQAETLARFTQYFLGTLYDTYGPALGAA